MSTTQTAAATGDAAIAAPAPGAARYNRSLVGDTWRRFRRHKLAVIGAFLYIALVLLTLIGPMVWRTPINDIDFSASNSFSAAHPLGTDDLGRDTLARVLWGGRVSIAVGLCAMLVAITIGVLIGAVAGFFGGWVDIALSRIIEVFLSVPQLPLLLLVTYLYRNAIVAVVGPELGVFLMIVAATLSVGASMIAESTLSFLGLGFPPDVPTWGRLLFDAQNFLTIAPATAIIPGTMIVLAVLSINFVGDGLRDALDPRRTL